MILSLASLTRFTAFICLSFLATATRPSRIIKRTTKSSKKANRKKNTKKSKKVKRVQFFNQFGTNIADTDVREGFQCYDSPYKNKIGMVKGSMVDCVDPATIEDVTAECPEGAFFGFTFDAITTFIPDSKRRDRTIVTSCNVKVCSDPSEFEFGYNANTFCDNIFEFEGRSGRVQLNGRVNNENYFITTELKFDNNWTITWL